MNKVITEQELDNWIDALRSGEFAQAQGSLRKTMDMEDGAFGYCCLGLKCQIDGFDLDSTYQEENWDDTLGQHLFADSSGLGDGVNVPEPIEGLSVATRMSLADANDAIEGHHTFEMIADALDRNRLHLLAGGDLNFTYETLELVPITEDGAAL